MGFCLFSNVAVAARVAQAAGMARVAVVDFDVHHGNGTQAAFEADDSLFFGLDPPDAALSGHRRGRPRRASATSSTRRRAPRGPRIMACGLRGRADAGAG